MVLKMAANHHVIIRMSTSLVTYLQQMRYVFISLCMARVAPRFASVEYAGEACFAVLYFRSQKCPTLTTRLIPFIAFSFLIIFAVSVPSLQRRPVPS